jgi:hypothetical protein
MRDDLTDHEIALLCDLGEQDQSELIGDKKRDLERLISGGYVALAERQPGPTFQLTAKARKFLGERGAGLNEA